MIIDDYTMLKDWQTVAAQLEAVTDNLGMPIDPGILPTCIALTLLRFTTTQSCEGHIDWGERAPWVEVLCAKAEAANQQALEVLLRGQIIDETQPAHPPKYRHDAVMEGCMGREQAECLLNGERDRLLGYLHQFYRERQVPDDRRLIVQINMPYLTLRCQGTAELADLDVESQYRKLSEYQEEMRDFTDFLITTYHLHEQVSHSNKKSGTGVTSIGRKKRKKLPLHMQ
jgi:hypothetical protein